MHKYLSVLALLIPAVFGRQARAEVPETLEVFAISSNLLVNAVSSADETLLLDAHEGFASLEAEETLDYVLTQKRPGDLCKADIQFNEDFCTELRKNNFKLVELDPLSFTRRIEPGLLTITGAVSPGGCLVYSLEGTDDMALGIAESIPGALSVSVSSNGAETAVAETSEGNVRFLEWMMPADITPFSITLENPSDEKISFTIAMP